MLPSVFLITVGAVTAAGPRRSSGLLLAAFGLGALMITAPFLLRLGCWRDKRGLVTFVFFRAKRLPSSRVSSIDSEPFGSGSRIVATMADRTVQPLLLTPQPPWVGDTDHEHRVAHAVGLLQSHCSLPGIDAAPPADDM